MRASLNLIALRFHFNIYYKICAPAPFSPKISSGLRNGQSLNDKQPQPIQWSSPLRSRLRR